MRWESFHHGDKTGPAARSGAGGLGASSPPNALSPQLQQRFAWSTESPSSSTPSSREHRDGGSVHPTASSGVAHEGRKKSRGVPLVHSTRHDRTRERETMLEWDRSVTSKEPFSRRLGVAPGRHATTSQLTNTVRRLSKWRGRSLTSTKATYTRNARRNTVTSMPPRRRSSGESEMLGHVVLSGAVELKRHHFLGGSMLRHWCGRDGVIAVRLAPAAG